MIVLREPDLRGDVLESPFGRLTEHAAQTEAVHIEIEPGVVVVVHPSGAGCGGGFRVQRIEAGASCDIGETEAAVVPVERASAIAARADEQDVVVAVGVNIPDGCAGEERGPERVDVREPAIEVGRHVLVGKAGGRRHFLEASASAGPNVREGRCDGQAGDERAGRRQRVAISLVPSSGTCRTISRKRTAPPCSVATARP